MPTSSVPPAAVHDAGRLRALASYGILDTAPEQGFDDIVQLATRLCTTPVALVSLVAENRQWFKARVGFPECQTDLNSSVCAHALTEPDLLIIPDLTQDPRTWTNPLVTGAPFIRFYAGAPLRTPEGEVIGSLCVIDSQPRPGGLTETQASDLRALSRQVMSQMELRREVARRDELLAAQQAAMRAREAYAETLNAITARGGDLDAILDALVAGAMQAVPVAEGGVIELIDGDALEYRAVRGTLTGHRGLRVPLQGSTAGHCALNNQPVLMTDALTDARVKADLIQPLNLRSAVFAPVTRGDQVLGVLKLQSSRPAAFTDHELELARLFAGLANAGLTEAREIAAQHEIQLGEDRLRRAQVAGGVGLFSIGMADSVLHPTPEFCRLYGLTVRDSYPAEAFEQLIIPEDQHLISTARSRRSGEAPRDVEYRIRRPDTGELRWIARKGEIEVDAAGQPVCFAGVARDITERRAAQEALAASERHWRSLFEQLREGVVLARVVRDASGRVVDWRYEQVNQAWGELVGLAPEAAVGRTIRELFPAIEESWIESSARVVETGQSLTFTDQVGQIGRWYEGRAHKLTAETFVVLFQEITDRVLAEQAQQADAGRKVALAELGERLRELTRTPEMTRAAAEIVGRTLQASRAGFGRLDARLQHVTIEADWTSEGQVSTAGRHRISDYGKLGQRLRQGRPAIIADVTQDPLTRAKPAPLLSLGVAALMNMPVRERGRSVALFFAHHAAPRVWTAEEVAFLRAVADRVEAAVARVHAEEQRDLLNRELSHRMKNTLAMVQAIATQTLRNAPDVHAARSVLDARLVALGRAHDILIGGEGEGADMRDVVASALSLHDDQRPGRFALEGPPLPCGPQAALSLALMLHELATNAAKYGALSTPEGRVSISWTVTGPPVAETVRLTWQEQGGPVVTPPTRKGFGSRLIERGLAGTVGGRIETQYRPEGVHCQLTAPVAGFAAEA